MCYAPGADFGSGKTENLLGGNISAPLFLNEIKSVPDEKILDTPLRI